MVLNLFLFIIFELASGFCQSLGPFLAVRALYGLCMGVGIVEIQTRRRLNNGLRDFWRQLPRQHLKISLTRHVVYSQDSSSKDML